MPIDPTLVKARPPAIVFRNFSLHNTKVEIKPCPMTVGNLYNERADRFDSTGNRLKYDRFPATSAVAHKLLMVNSGNCRSLSGHQISHLTRSVA